ncbi:MAG: RNA polymerase sigma factor [Gammaproteobacteria bacterium]
MSRHRWIAAHILPLEAQVRVWLARHVRSLISSDIDDLIQEAYSRIWSADFSDVHSPRAYFYQSLRNLLIERARHAQIVPMERMGEIDALRIPSEEPGPERLVSARQELERVTALIAGLPAQCRRAFELRKMHGLRQKDVAARMGISERTVEKHLAKALDRLLQAIAGSEARDKSHEDSYRSDRHGIGTQRD